MERLEKVESCSQSQKFKFYTLNSQQQQQKKYGAEYVGGAHL